MVLEVSDTTDGHLDRFKKYMSEPKQACMAIVLFCSIVFLLLLAITQGRLLNYMMCNSDSCIMPDFVEVLQRSSQGTPYEQGSTYFPFIFLICKVLSLFIPGIGELETREILIDDPLAISVICLFLICFIICMIPLIIKIKKTDFKAKYKIAAACLLIISPAIIWGLERGNIIFFTLPFLLFYFFNYDSESKRIRILATIFLAIAISIKPYTVIFSLLLFNDKRYKAILDCILIFILLNTIAILFFGGISQFPVLFSNMVRLNEDSSFIDIFKIDTSNLLFEIGLILGCSNSIMESGCAYAIIVKLIKYLLVVALAISSLLSRNKCEIMIAGTLLYIEFSNVSWDYLLIFLLIPFIYLMFYQEKLSKQDNRYLWIITLCLTALPFYYPTFNVGFNTGYVYYLIVSVFVLIVSCFISYHIISGAVIKLKDKKCKNIECNQ